MSDHYRDRRGFIKSSLIATSSVALGPLFSGLISNNAFANNKQSLNEQIPIYPVADSSTGLKLLKLPQGFTYSSFGWTGDLMGDGTFTPDRHDGMAVVDYDLKTRTLTLMRNHERGEVKDAVIGLGKAPIYDHYGDSANESFGGGVTALMLRDGKLVNSQAALGGTIYNCAGGATPWGSWLTCEEYVIGKNKQALESKLNASSGEHGYVFEVPAPRFGRASAKPIVDMGKMKHEAVAVDPNTGIVYLTEDNGPHSGFYRFIPNNKSQMIGALEEGGKLQMLKVVAQSNADLSSPTNGDRHLVEWVTIDDPNLDLSGSQSGPYSQGEVKGGAKFLRGEGCWYHKSVIYMVDTSAGASGKGVVWVYKPYAKTINNTEGELVALFVSPGQETANNPDNITISPRDGILFCEDGGSFTNHLGETVGSRLVAIDSAGLVSIFAENNIVINSIIKSKPLIDKGDYRGQEFCGACFDPLGKILFVNIQTPGITFAINGPWERVGL